MPKTSKGKTGRRIPGAKRGKTMKVTTRVKVREPKPQTKATMMNIVNRILNRKTETRFLAQPITLGQSGGQPVPIWENDIPSLDEWSVALPQQVQGDNRETRIGDSISPTDHRVKLKLRFAMKNIAGVGEPPSYVGCSEPLDVTVYIFYGLIRSLKTYQGVTSISGVSRIVTPSGSTEATKAMANLLDKGDGTFTPFTGDPALAQYPLSEYVSMKVKKVRLHKPAGWVNTAAGALTTTGEASSDGIHEREVVLRFKAPTKLKYTNAQDSYPNNYAPVFSVGYVFNDAASNPAAVGYLYGNVEYSAIAMLRYKDFE